MSRRLAAFSPAPSAASSPVASPPPVSVSASAGSARLAADNAQLRRELAAQHADLYHERAQRARLVGELRALHRSLHWLHSRKEETIAQLRDELSQEEETTAQLREELSQGGEVIAQMRDELLMEEDTTAHLRGEISRLQGALAEACELNSRQHDMRLGLAQESATVAFLAGGAVVAAAGVAALAWSRWSATRRKA